MSQKFDDPEEVIRHLKQMNVGDAVRSEPVS